MVGAFDGGFAAKDSALVSHCEQEDHKAQKERGTAG
jgi:hypothetical protein